MTVTALAGCSAGTGENVNSVQDSSEAAEKTEAGSSQNSSGQDAGIGQKTGTEPEADGAALEAQVIDADLWDGFSKGTALGDGYSYANSTNIYTNDRKTGGDMCTRRFPVKRKKRPLF